MANQNGIASRKENKSRVPEGPEVFSLGVMRICAAALFSMWDVAIMLHISLRQIGRVLDLGLMDLSLMRACAPARRQRAATGARDQPRT
jgi:hypothetical protein